MPLEFDSDGYPVPPQGLPKYDRPADSMEELTRRVMETRKFAAEVRAYCEAGRDRALGVEPQRPTLTLIQGGCDA